METLNPIEKMRERMHNEIKKNPRLRGKKEREQSPVGNAEEKGIMDTMTKTDDSMIKSELEKIMELEQMMKKRYSKDKKVLSRLNEGDGKSNQSKSRNDKDSFLSEINDKMKDDLSDNEVAIELEEKHDDPTDQSKDNKRQSDDLRDSLMHRGSFLRGVDDKID